MNGKFRQRHAPNMVYMLETWRMHVLDMIKLGRIMRGA